MHYLVDWTVERASHYLWDWAVERTSHYLGGRPLSGPVITSGSGPVTFSVIGPVFMTAKCFVFSLPSLFFLQSFLVGYFKQED